MTFVKYLPLDMNTFYDNNDDRMPDTHEAYIAKIITSVKLSKKERNNLLKALDQDLMSEDDIRQAVQKSQKYDPTIEAILHRYKRRFPDAMIMGCKKCGTTFLGGILRKHPNIAMRQREGQYLHKYHDDERQKQYHRDMMKRSFEDQITMEKSPNYWSIDSAPEEINKVNPHAKLILLVRDPACRLASDFYHEQRYGTIHSNVTFSELMLKDKYVNMQAFLLKPSLYDERMENWLKLFPLSQFMIIKNEDMTTSKFTSILRELETFLGIPHRFHIIQNSTAICVKHRIRPDNERCSMLRSSSATCSYDRDFKSLMAAIRTLLKSHLSRFESIVKRNFHWF